VSSCFWYQHLALQQQACEVIKVLQTLNLGYPFSLENIHKHTEIPVEQLKLYLQELVEINQVKQVKNYKKCYTITYLGRERLRKLSLLDNIFKITTKENTS
jgi:predicted transcriptional regulator